MDEAIEWISEEVWSLYYDTPPDETPDDTRKTRMTLAKLFDRRLASIMPTPDQMKPLADALDEDADAMRSYSFSYQDVLNLLNDPEFEEAFKQNTAEILDCLGIAIQKHIARNFVDQPIELRKIVARIVNYPLITPIRNIKANMMGRLVCVRGTVVRVASAKPIARSMVFQCQKCTNVIKLALVDGKYVAPEACELCKFKHFTVLKDLADGCDWQRIKLQEVENHTETGRVPRTIEVELTDDLVDTCVPGDVVTVLGIVKVVPTDMLATGVSKRHKRPMFFGYIDANSLQNSKQIEGGKLDTLVYSQRDVDAFNKISTHPNPFGLLCKSICPTIYGHEMVKAGMTLSLFGGRTKYRDQESSSMRGDIHMMVVGDPGLGKSQLLSSLSKIAPRGVYICGSYASEAGLTVAIQREEGSGDYSLEAGALVLSDQGMCCVDEFDKMTKEWQALLEAMEQQSISVAKAGIVCNLPARASLVAAANPVSGHYDKSKTISQNLKMTAALLSRFDLIFIILDKHDQHRDALLSEHIINMRTGGPSTSPSGSLHNSQSSDSTINTMTQRQISNQLDSLVFAKRRAVAGHATAEARETLKDQLIDPDLDATDPIPAEIFRKYVSYAKSKFFPSLSPEAIQIIQDYYLKLRASHKMEDGTPVTTRQLESLIRLAEARAKLELRELVTAKDATDIIEIMDSTLADVREPDSNFFRAMQAKTGTKMGKQKMITTFITALQARKQALSQDTFEYKALLDLSKELRLPIPVFSEFIDELNLRGYIIKCGSNLYKITV